MALILRYCIQVDFLKNQDNLKFFFKNSELLKRFGLHFIPESQIYLCISLYLLKYLYFYFYCLISIPSTATFWKFK